MQAVFAIITLLSMVLTACSSMSGSRVQYYVCPFDTAWDAAIDTMKPYSITSQNKEKGSIETAWIEMEGKERSFGIFNREGFGNKERARLNAQVKQDNDVASVSILETRQRWHARGGVTQQATRWWPIDPSPEVLQEITARLNTKLQEKGCPAS